MRQTVHNRLIVMGIATVLSFIIVVVIGSNVSFQPSSGASGGASQPAVQDTPTPTPVPDTPIPERKVTISGRIDGVETVGLPATLNITATNEGSDIANLVLDFDGLGSWVIDDVTGCNGQATALQGFGNPYDFGAVSTGNSCAITLDLSPKSPGNPTLSVLTYTKLDSSGSFDINSSADNPEASVQWQPAINP